MNPTARPHLLRPRALVLFTLLLSGCASARRPAPAYRTTVQLAPVAAPADSASPADAAALPALPVTQMATSEGPARRIEQLQVADEDLRTVIRTLAESYGLDYEIDPSVTGRVTTRLRGVTLQQALDAVVVPHGYSYDIQGRVLRVTPARMPTRMFALDYISMARSGVGSTVVQRRLSGAANDVGNAGFLSRFGSGTDIIQSVTVSDLWEQIRVSLEGLVFDTPAADASGAGAAANPVAGNAGYNGLARAAGAYSRVGEDGRRLIINPMSGTILVSAPAERLGQVGRFIATVEASVQRQVLIEAKIVEVELNRHSEFGIDWSFMGLLGGTAVSGGASHPLPSPTGSANSSGGVEFTLGGAGDKVNVVLHALETQGDVRVLSSPRVSALNNQPAVINVTTDQVFFSITRQPILGPNGGTIGFNTEVVPQQVAVGIVLNVFPQISADNTIIMSVRPVVTDLKGEKKIQLADETQVSAPIIDRRESDTVVRVRGGETVVLGGLIQTSEGEESSGIPILSDIPLIGGLFGGSSRSETRRELVIFLTPTIVAGQAPSGAGK